MGSGHETNMICGVAGRFVKSEPVANMLPLAAARMYATPAVGITAAETTCMGEIFIFTASRKHRG